MKLSQQALGLILAAVISASPVATKEKRDTVSGGLIPVPNGIPDLTAYTKPITDILDGEGSIQDDLPIHGLKEKRDTVCFDQGEPISADGKGGPILGGTNKQLDLQNPDNLGRTPTDNGVVPNLKWSFSDSKTRLLKGGWVREQVITDLPQSTDVSAAQQHIKKGALRELHWHRVVSYVYILILNR
jgi:hypothetical protein